MARKGNGFVLAAAYLGLALLSAPANATLIAYEAIWEQQAGGSGVAKAMMLIDTDLLTSDGASLDGGCGPCSTPTVPGWVSGFQINISGASAGNGTFAQADFRDIYLDINTPPGVDVTQQLLGQAGFFDFNFFSSNAGAPSGVNVGIFQTVGGTSDGFTLISLSPATVPTPGTLLLVGLGLWVLVLRRKQPVY